MSGKVTQLVAAALLCAAGMAAMPVQAEVLDFEGLAPRPVGYLDSFDYKGYNFLGDSGVEGAIRGDLVGGVIDSVNPGACIWLACPGAATGTYLAGLNDGVMLVSRPDQQAFSVQSLSASFIGGYQGVEAPEVAGILRIQGFRADNTYEAFDIELPTIEKQFFFDSYSTGLFGQEKFVAVAFYTFACDFSGDCLAFETNAGQFGIDNLNLTMGAVPEPSTYLMLGAGLLAMVVRRRRAA